MVGSSEGRTGTEGGRACNCQALHMLAWPAPNRPDGASFQLHSRCTPRIVIPAISRACSTPYGADGSLSLRGEPYRRARRLQLHEE